MQQLCVRFYQNFTKKFCERLCLYLYLSKIIDHIFLQLNMLLLHKNSFFPLKTCQYHIVLISSSTEDLLQKLEDLSYLYQTVDCFYTLYKHQFFGNILEESGLIFTQLDRAVQNNYENKFVEKLPSVSKKD